MKLEHKIFNIQMYDKRVDFPILIVRILQFTNNIPSEMFYSVFGAEILRKQFELPVNVKYFAKHVGI